MARLARPCPLTSSAGCHGNTLVSLSPNSCRSGRRDASPDAGAAEVLDGEEPVAEHVHLYLTGEDTSIDVIHRFYEIGLAWLNAQWAGSRSRPLSPDGEDCVIWAATTRRSSPASNSPAGHRTTHPRRGRAGHGCVASPRPGAGARHGDGRWWPAPSCRLPVPMPRSGRSPGRLPPSR